MLSRREAAQSLRKSVRTVDRLIAAGQLTAVKIGASTLIRRTDLDRYVAGLASAGSFGDEVNVRTPREPRTDAELGGHGRW